MWSGPSFLDAPHTWESQLLRSNRKHFSMACRHYTKAKQVPANARKSVGEGFRLQHRKLMVPGTGSKDTIYSRFMMKEYL